MSNKEGSAQTRVVTTRNSEDICPRCGTRLRCLGGCSAHHTNWYCSDEKGCGWEAWNGKTNVERVNARNKEAQAEICRAEA